jgi:DNA-binding transcriptional LysR family regulator
MELNQLEAFLAVAEERSFSRAAARLHRTQPAVSQVKFSSTAPRAMAR